MTYARQFALPFPHAAHYTEASFVAGAANEEALAWLARPDAWPGRRLAVHGPSGSGKTHVLHVFAARHRAAWLPAEALRPLARLPDGAALAIDDADTVPDPETLLHVLNRAAERGMAVMLSGRAAPAQWGVALPDLASRLRAIHAVGLGQPDDGLLRAIFAHVLAERQLAVPERLLDYLLARLPRTGAALWDAASRLDRLALASGGQVTRGIAAAVALDAEIRDAPHETGDLLEGR